MRIIRFICEFLALKILVEVADAMDYGSALGQSLSYRPAKAATRTPNAHPD